MNFSSMRASNCLDGLKSKLVGVLVAVIAIFFADQL
jgi:uncharacterized membrane protein YqhA